MTSPYIIGLLLVSGYRRASGTAGRAVQTYRPCRSRAYTIDVSTVSAHRNGASTAGGRNRRICKISRYGVDSSRRCVRGQRQRCALHAQWAIATRGFSAITNHNCSWIADAVVTPLFGACSGKRNTAAARLYRIEIIRARPNLWDRTPSMEYQLIPAGVRYAGRRSWGGHRSGARTCGAIRGQ